MRVAMDMAEFVNGRLEEKTSRFSRRLLPFLKSLDQASAVKLAEKFVLKYGKEISSTDLPEAVLAKFHQMFPNSTPGDMGEWHWDHLGELEAPDGGKKYVSLGYTQKNLGFNGRYTSTMREGREYDVYADKGGNVTESKMIETGEAIW